MILIVYVSLKVWIVKDVIKQMFKQPRFGTPFKNQHVKGSQTIVKSG